MEAFYMKIIMRRDSVIFYFENNRIDNAVRRCLLNKTKPFYLELVLATEKGARSLTGRTKIKARNWLLTLPIPGFVSVVGLAVLQLSGDGVRLAPGLAFGLVELALFLLGKLLVGNEFFHTDSSLWFLESVYHNCAKMNKRFVNPECVW